VKNRQKSGPKPWRQLKTAVEQACSALRVSHRDFAQGRGLQDLLMDAETGNWDAETLALKALEHCCQMPPGTFEQVAVLAIVDLLDSALGKPAEDDPNTKRRARDLWQIVGGGADPKGCKQWLHAWYG